MPSLSNSVHSCVFMASASLSYRYTVRDSQPSKVCREEHTLEQGQLLEQLNLSPTNTRCPVTDTQDNKECFDLLL